MFLTAGGASSSTQPIRRAAGSVWWRTRRMSMVCAVVAGSLLSGLSFTPSPLAAAGVNAPRLDGAETPPPIVADGSQTFPFVEAPAFTPRAVEALPVADETLTAELGDAVPVDGLPIEIELIDESVGADPATPPGQTSPSSTSPSSTSTTVAASATSSTTTTVAAAGTVGDGEVVLDVQSLAAADVKALGGELLAFDVSVADSEPGVPVEVELSVDYSGFRYAFGADWAERVQLVRWACPIEVAEATPQACGEPIPVEGVIDESVAGVLTATVIVQDGVIVEPGGGGQALRLYQTGSTLGLASSAGTFAATTLSSSGQWQVGGNTGAFSYNYPIEVPPALIGMSPSVALSYSSTGADGVTSAVNSQSGPVGIGWDLSAGQGFIERRYLPCTDSRIGGGTSDTCWYTQNGTISLNGHASELVPLAGATGDANSMTVFRLKDDPDWIVTRHPGGGADWWVGEKWSVVTPDGVTYWFGLNDQTQNSVLTRPIRGLFAGEPCYLKSSRLCDAMPYRWMLDKVVDPYGNGMHLTSRDRCRVVSSIICHGCWPS